MPTAKEIQELLDQPLTILAGQASMCWDPPPSAQVFAAERAVRASIATTAAVAEQLERLFARDVERIRVELEEYRMRLAGALTALDGHRVDQADENMLPFLRSCPTIAAAVRVRRRLEELAARVAGRCSVCGAPRVKGTNGELGACSLVPGADGKGGCPDPMHDVELERLAAERLAEGRPSL